jgi:hypothetical protein
MFRISSSRKILVPAAALPTGGACGLSGEYIHWFFSGTESTGAFDISIAAPVSPLS